MSDDPNHHPADPGQLDTMVVTAPEDFDVPGLRVFLGGAIDGGEAHDWQADVGRALAGRPDLVLVNPRRPRFDVTDLDDQIRWELAALETVDLILMWFPGGTLAPVALLETGLYLTSGRIILGAARSYPRRRNLELAAARHGVPVMDRLDELVAVVAQLWASCMGCATRNSRGS